MAAELSLGRGTDQQRPVEYAHPWLADLIFSFDRLLQRRNGVFEFTSNPRCLFRLQLDLAERDVMLADGTRVRPLDRVVRLHFWNEHIPSVPPLGASIGWARRMYYDTEVSLRELASFFAVHPEFDDIAVICGNMVWGTGDQRAQLARVTRRLGFEVFTEADPIGARERIHRFGENILVSLMILAQNTPALRRDSLWRDRTEIFLSRHTLESRYGGGLGSKG